MRILHFSYSRNFGGAAVAAGRLFEAQRRRGREVSFLGYSGKGEGASRVPALIQNKVAWLRRLQKLMAGRYKSARAFNLVATGMGRWLNCQPADIIHLHWIGHQVMGWPDLRALEKPVVWTFHDTWPLISSLYYQGAMATRPEGILERRFLRERDVTFSQLGDRCAGIGPSSWMAGLVNESRLFRNDRIYHIPYCLEGEFGQLVDRVEVRRRLHLPEDAKVFIAGASFQDEPRKGLDVLLKAWAAADIRDAQLVLFGGRRLSRSEGPRVRDEGKLDCEQLGDLFAAADWLVSPSLEENFSNLIIEAMIAGVPVIGLPVGGTPDLVVDGETGLLATDTSVSALAAQLVRAHGVSVPGGFGERARIRTLHLVDADKIVHAHDRVYEQLAERG